MLIPSPSRRPGRIVQYRPSVPPLLLVRGWPFAFVSASAFATAAAALRIVGPRLNFVWLLISNKVPYPDQPYDPFVLFSSASESGRGTTRLSVVGTSLAYLLTVHRRLRDRNEVADVGSTGRATIQRTRGSLIGQAAGGNEGSSTERSSDIGGGKQKASGGRLFGPDLVERFSGSTKGGREAVKRTSSHCSSWVSGQAGQWRDCKQAMLRT